MEVEDAVRAAKDYVSELFAPEGVDRIGLEEIEGNNSGIWKITIGFSRNWDHSIGSVLAGPSRTYKVISIDANSGRILSVKHRSLRNTE